jgi:hypothetical protein
MKATIDYLDRKILEVFKEMLDEDRLIAKYPIRMRFDKGKNKVSFTGFDKLKTTK